MKLDRFRVAMCITAFLAFTIFLLTQPSRSQATYNWKWSPDVHFKLPAYNTVVAFDDWVYMNSFSWDDADATEITFSHIKTDGETLSSWSVSVENANVTINDFFKDSKLTFTVSAPSGTTSTTKIFVGDFGKPISVTGATSWSFDSSSRTVTINVLHSSPQQVVLDWVAPLPLISLIRSNYYLLFGLISLAPIIMAVTIIINLIKAKQQLELRQIYEIIIVFTILVLGFIVIWNVMNALIGG